MSGLVVKLYPASYSVPRRPELDHAGRLIAARLHDKYDPETQSLVRHSFVPYDYFGTAASESRTLVAFDKSWVVAALAERLDIGIYPFGDDYMVFANVSLDEAEALLVYLYRDTQLYKDTAYLVKRMSLDDAKRYQTLYPIEYKPLAGHFVLSSTILGQEELEHLYKYGELYVPYPRVDDITGAYAMYLLAESLFFAFSLRWENGVLYMGLCGYIQAMEMARLFADMLTRIQKQGVRFYPLPDYASAKKAAKKAKCFYHRGVYYSIRPSAKSKKTDTRYSLIEMLTPLVAVTRDDTRAEALLYLKSLGYDISPDPESPKECAL